MRRSPPGGAACISLDTYMPSRVYSSHGIRVRHHRGAEPPRDPEPPGLVRAVGGGDRAPAADAAAHRLQAPAGAPRGGLRGIHGGRAAPPLPAPAGAAPGGGRLARSEEHTSELQSRVDISY